MKLSIEAQEFEQWKAEMNLFAARYHNSPRAQATFQPSEQAFNLRALGNFTTIRALEFEQRKAEANLRAAKR